MGVYLPIQLQSRRAFPCLSSMLPERADSPAQVQTFSPTLSSYNWQEQILAGNLTIIC